MTDRKETRPVLQRNREILTYVNSDDLPETAF